MSARDDILARLRAARGPAASALPDRYLFARDSKVAWQQFVERAAAVGTEVLPLPAQAWVDAAARGLRTRHVRSAAVWDDSLLAPLATVLQTEGVELIPSEQHTTERLAGVDVGITTADFAIALSGTLVLNCDAQRPRSTSLLPPLHVAVLEAARIVPTLADLFRRVGSPLPSALTFISGPSRTSDIELTPVLGVHGPVEVVVYLLT